jgi:hypothetical protein
MNYKIKAMMDWPIPKALKNLRGFDGFDRLLPQVCSELWKNSSTFNGEELRRMHFHGLQRQLNLLNNLKR